MARNQEKAQSTLNRWLAYKQDLARGGTGSSQTTFRPQRRPNLASNCDSVSECEKWRMQILREVGKKIMEIQNESLGEQRIRDLNDEINKLLREKGHWERRIIELGGPNYRKYERIADEALLKELNPEASLQDEQRGYTYKYFGAAKNLPGVKDLYLKKQENSKRLKLPGQMKGIDAEYYGYKSDQDIELQVLEQEAERNLLEAAVKQWEKDQSGKTNASPAGIEAEVDMTNVPVPTRDQMEKALVQRRKAELMKRYMSDELASSLEQEKEQVEVVLGKRKQPDQKL